ncbi:MAG: vitamin K epoxide reductase family protein [Nesterenkonia sp.]|uniref:vitamin K epoxide reductase family protein n=1 Tax=Nesterenkonia marinintestina TaxID=2979865 RepID=UPI0021BE1DAE|nr:vitamin K epoxide reductase family protein [Nesterenkonia sp. GX14115]MDO5492259.1 vitamin K epoxide reductase family protein [Nesterenkonia sp.]
MSTDTAARSETDRAWIARRVPLGLWTVLTGAVGVVGSFMLLYERVLLWQDPDHATACDVNPWVSCGEVMQSWQAATFGFPNIFLGVVGFPLVVLAGLTILSGARTPRAWWWGLQAGVTFALGFCVWLWYSAVYSIGVLCPYCMVVWAGTIPLALGVTAGSVLNGVIPSTARVRRLTSDWWWVAVILVFLLVLASIVLEKPEAFGV